MDRLTPMDIFNKDFKSSFRGYDVEEVNEFLDIIIKNYEEVLQENEQLKAQLSKQIPQHTQESLMDQVLYRLDRLEKMVQVK